MTDDPVNPKHYTDMGIYSPVHIIEKYGLGFHLGNSIKYILRAGKKGDRLTDLKKAQWYLQREIDNESTS